MEFDAFTIVAQILNFAVLLFVLKRFLYRPILSAMERRESAIDERLQQAEEVRENASMKVEEYEQKLEDIESEREERLEALREEISEESKRLHRSLRERVETIEEEWRESLVRDGQRQLENYRESLENEVVATVRQALVSLADENLETRLLERFLVRIERLEDKDIRKLVGEDDGPHGVKILTAFGIDEAREDEIRKKLQSRFGENVHLSFEVDTALVAGVELRCAGHRLGWSIDDYLDALARRMHADLKGISHGEIVETHIREAWDA